MALFPLGNVQSPRAKGIFAADGAFARVFWTFSRHRATRIRAKNNFAADVAFARVYWTFFTPTGDLKPGRTAASRPPGLRPRESGTGRCWGPFARLQRGLISRRPVKLHSLWVKSIDKSFD
jgi:hypothetical protein